MAGRRKVEAVETATEVGRSPDMNVHIGDKIALVVSAAQEITVGPITLNFKNRTAIIPPTITGPELILLEKHSRAGAIISLGKEQNNVPAEASDKMLSICRNKLQSYNSLKDFLSGLVRSNTHIEGWAPKDLIEEMIKMEHNGKNRRDILALLDRARPHQRLISFISEPFDEKKHCSPDIIYDIRFPAPKAANKK